MSLFSLLDISAAVRWLEGTNKMDSGGWGNARALEI